MSELEIDAVESTQAVEQDRDSDGFERLFVAGVDLASSPSAASYCVRGSGVNSGRTLILKVLLPSTISLIATSRSWGT